MFFLEDIDGHTMKFDTLNDAKEYIEIRHAEKGSWDWISELTDDKGKNYVCTWKLEIEEL